MDTSPAGPDAAAVLAGLHGQAFDEPWSAPDIAALLESPGVFARQALAGTEAPAGFILCRVVADEAEVLTLAVRPTLRRRGVAAALLSTACAAALAAGAAAMFLEVAEDNLAALGLYRSQGFGQVGRRHGYYSRPEGAVSALILRLDLNRSGAGPYA